MIKKMKEKAKEQRLKEVKPLVKSEEMILDDDDLFEFVLFNMKGNRKLNWREKITLNYIDKHGEDEFDNFVKRIKLLYNLKNNGLIENKNNQIIRSSKLGEKIDDLSDISVVRVQDEDEYLPNKEFKIVDRIFKVISCKKKIDTCKEKIDRRDIDKIIIDLKRKDYLEMQQIVDRIKDLKNEKFYIEDDWSRLNINQEIINQEIISLYDYLQELKSKAKDEKRYYDLAIEAYRNKESLDSGLFR